MARSPFEGLWNPSVLRARCISSRPLGVAAQIVDELRVDGADVHDRPCREEVLDRRSRQVAGAHYRYDGSDISSRGMVREARFTIALIAPGVCRCSPAAAHAFG